MNKKGIAGYLALLTLLLSAGSVAAHEFWISPVYYVVPLWQNLRADIRTGQGFKGDAFPYIPDNSILFNITEGNRTRPIKSRIGDLPAVNEPVESDGLLILSHVSSDAYLTYKSDGKFEAFTARQGLDWVLPEHRRRGLPAYGFSEAYQRFAKSLVSGGEGRGADRALGLRLEWVIETNPYTTSGSEITARLLWQGAPAANTQARLFTRLGNSVDETVLITDAQGRVSFPVQKGSEILLNTVRMIPPAEARQPWRKGVVWKSLWASTTFSRP